MALVLKDRVRVTSSTTGTGTFTLGAASAGYQDFSVIGDGNTTYYAIQNSGDNTWEVGIGTYTASGTTLSRDTILESSNGGTAVNFAAGTKDVFVTYPAEKGIYLDASGNSVGLGTPASATLTNATGLPLSTGVTGTLPIANGGTGTTSTTFTNLTTNVTGTLPVANGGTGITSLGTGVATFLGTPSSANLAAAVTDETGSGALVFATSPTLTTPVLGTPSSGTLTSCTGLPLTTGVTGTLPVANGGTGVTTSTGTINNVLSASPTFTVKTTTTSSINWNFSQLDLVRNTTNSTPTKFVSMLLDGDSISSTTVGAYNAIWGAYDSAPTTSSTSAALNGAMVYGAYAGHRWVNNGTEYMRITSTGNVGIGTTSPDALLTVNTIASFGDGAVGTPSIAHKGDLNTGLWFPIADTIAASTAGTERMRITSAGNVGIGTASPTSTLTVTGTGITNASWTTAGRPSSPVAGQIGYNTTNNVMEYYDGTNWRSFANTSNLSSYLASYLVVGGGGGGSKGTSGVTYGGGGGGGGTVATSASLTVGTSYTVTVGGGGAAGGGAGTNSSFNSSTGGGGVSGNANGNGGASGTPQSNAGVNKVGVTGGAGGGAGGAGSTTTGGAGSSSSISGSSVNYGGGGGGSNDSVSGSGTDGGGNGGAINTPPTSGTANRGGGGGSTRVENANNAGAGGSGVVILSVPTALYSGTTTGSPTVTTSGANTILTFTASGSYTA